MRKSRYCAYTKRCASYKKNRAKIENLKAEKNKTEIDT